MVGSSTRRYNNNNFKTGVPGTKHVVSSEDDINSPQLSLSPIKLNLRHPRQVTQVQTLLNNDVMDAPVTPKNIIISPKKKNHDISVEVTATSPKRGMFM